MNSVELLSILEKYVNKNYKIGVYACDLIKNIKGKKICLIVNTDESSEPGTHWLAIYKNGSNIEFFDSFGLPVTFYNKKILRFIKANGKKFKFNMHQFQSNLSNVCGHFCLFYLLHRAKNISMKNIIKMFSLTNFKYNDKLVKNFVNVKFKSLKALSKQKIKCMQINKHCRTC